MAKRRRNKKARKIFPAKYNASRVHVGLNVETFKTSPKTGEIPGKHIEVFHYRRRGGSTPNAYLEAKFKDHKNWSSNTYWKDKNALVEKMQKGEVDPGSTFAVSQKRRELKEEKEAREILTLLDLHNLEVNAELRQDSWKNQTIERYWWKAMYHWDKNCKLRLYMTRTCFFFVEENVPRRELRMSMDYPSQERAIEVYTNDEIKYIEVFRMHEDPD